MAKRKKQAIVEKEPSLKKVPVWIGHPTHHDHPISWRFSAADVEGEFAWPKATTDERLTEVLDRLAEWEGMDMASLLECRNYYTNLSKLSPAARKRIQSIQQDDVQALFSFRVTKKARLWCMDAPGCGGIMFVLWWDPNHLVYPTGR